MNYFGNKNWCDFLNWPDMVDYFFWSYKFVWTQFLLITNSWDQTTKQQWYFVTKIVLTYCEKIVLVIEILEKLLKFEAEGQEFAKFLRSQKQFIQTAKDQNNFW